MIWTEDILQEAERLYWGRNSDEVADALTSRYSFKVTGATVRAAFSRVGIVDTKGYPKDQDKAKRLTRKFRSWGWSVFDIAEQLCVHPHWVRDVLRCEPLEWIQTALWPLEEVRAPKVEHVLRIVHRAQKSKNKPGVQLSLDLFTYSNAKAA